MSAVLIAVLLVVLYVGLMLLRKPKAPPAPYAPTLEEIMETDAKLRIIGGLDPGPTAPKKKAQRKASAADELP
jgi:hypothetical protein